MIFMWLYKKKRKTSLRITIKKIDILCSLNINEQFLSFLLHFRLIYNYS